MRKGLFSFVLGLLLLAIGFYLAKSSTSIKVKTQKVLSPTSTLIVSKTEKAKVLKVVDGDTVDVSINSQKETVRLIGIDAPEISDLSKPQCFGKEATDKAKELLNDKAIILEKDQTQDNRDKYNRLLRYVFLEDEINFNQLMLSEGFVREYTFKNISYKYQSEFKKAQARAKENKKGLWNVCQN